MKGPTWEESSQENGHQDQTIRRCAKRSGIGFWSVEGDKACKVG